MEAGIKSLDKFLEEDGIEFHVPVYQRDYAWNEEQCSELLKDILDIAENKDLGTKHFIGNIVYVAKGTT